MPAFDRQALQRLDDRLGQVHLDQFSGLASPQGEQRALQPIPRQGGHVLDGEARIAHQQHEDAGNTHATIAAYESVNPIRPTYRYLKP